MLTREYLRWRLSYNKKTGIFRWKRVFGHKVKVGDRTGSITDNGRRVNIWIDDKMYRAHRLAWFYVHGEWPLMGIDHINGDGCDNRIANLRLATQSQNLGNSKKPITNRSGKKGVSWHAVGKKWQAHIKVDGINFYLGLFDTVKLAHEAYAEAATKYRGEFARAE